MIKLLDFPRLPLAVFPTPLLHAPRLSKKLGTPFYFKRDDLISFGLGGNKIRGLEFIVADALAQGATSLVTGAGVQSNHVRATAAVAACYDLVCHAVYWGNPPDVVEANYRLTKMLGATVHFTGDNDRSSVDTGIETLARTMQNSYAIPRGGACVLGVLGHILAVEEVYQQCQQIGIKPKRIVLAGGSGGTCAGWLLGIQLLNLDWQVSCFSVSRPANELHAQIARLAQEANNLLKIDTPFNTDTIQINDEFIGAGYGMPSQEAAKAIRLIAQHEGVLLDPTYTGKAMAGFLHTIKQDETVIFIHSGGEPAFFAGNGDWLEDKSCV